MSARDLIDGEAELDDDEENEESFDEGTGEARQRTNGANGMNGHMNDSSEEEDDDDDEEKLREASRWSALVLQSGGCLIDVS